MNDQGNQLTCIIKTKLSLAFSVLFVPLVLCP